MLKKNISVFFVGYCFYLLQNTFALAGAENINDLIYDQQQILIQLNEKKAKQQQEALFSRISFLESQIKTLKNYDAEGAITAVSAQINALQGHLSAQLEAQNQIMKELKELKTRQEVQPIPSESTYSSTAATKKFLVNPGPASQVGFTQDAINAQGNSTMVFSYAPNQLYKIYCRVGFLTDLAFKKGEKISFVGGGDTSAWIIDSAEVDGVPHLYIKPIQPNSTTNLIVNTTKHSYQIIANAGDWYNPMVRWVYSSEEQLAKQLQAKKDEKIYAGSFNVSNPEQLNFSYEIKGNRDWKPSMVFDDGKKTYIKFDRLSSQMPLLFIKEPNRKEVSLVNYKVKDNYYVVDKIFKEAQLKLNDKDFIKIVAKR